MNFIFESFSAFIDSIDESNVIKLKRRYTENHPEISVKKAAAIRNNILEAIGDGKVSHQEIDNILSKHSKNGKAWLKKNQRLFDVNEDGISLSVFGKKILKSITVNESYQEFETEDEAVSYVKKKYKLSDDEAVTFVFDMEREYVYPFTTKEIESFWKKLTKK